MDVPHHTWRITFFFLAPAFSFCIVSSIPNPVSCLDLSNDPRRDGLQFATDKLCLWILAILFTACCCVLGLWITGNLKFSRFPAAFYGDFAKNRSRKRANGRWKDTRRPAPKACDCSRGCGGGKSARLGNCAGGEKNENQQQIAVHPSGTSMMEQLVPEITQHMLSYLDHKSLCNVSMTNSSMRRAANDDIAWKALFHKDFTVEQSCIVPQNGWKAHYAVTKAVLEVNRSFYKSFRAKSLRGMSRLWLHADYIKCIHPGGELLSGYDAVMDNWHSVFSWSQKFDFELHDERVRVVGDIAWVTLKELVNSSIEPLLASNVYEFHDGRWFIVHHHSSPQLEGGNVEYGLYG